MIGNDIVDLKQSPSSWKRPRFLEKVFTEKEQHRIHTSQNQHQMIWLLWSMKEAAYKLHVQQYEIRFFNPKRLECELISEDKGIVTVDSDIYFTNSNITEDYVYTIAKQTINKAINTSIFKSETFNYLNQSTIIKQRILKSVSETEYLDIETLEIKKTEIGIPEFYSKSVKLPIHFSLTHCGRFSGFAY
nr:4'-phosphopantetheinyl transferase superfamily protein [uncultured Psychroserpens sp.]